MGLGPTQGYIVKYNTFTLPGYAQEESLPSDMNIASHYGTYADGSLSEYTGLSNKAISLTLKVWEQDYATCKSEVEKAATMLRSKRGGFAPLYVQYSNRHYDALTQSVKMQKTAGTSVRTLEYHVDFECKPWLKSDAIYTISGTGLLSTDTASPSIRAIDDGGWTPTTITVTGTNVTVSGYTATGDFAGFLSVSGYVQNLIIDSDAFTATIAGVNKNSLMKWQDYRVYAGPAKTYFNVVGASGCVIEYYNRWYI